MRKFDCDVSFEGDAYLDGALQSGSVPAARIDSGTLAVARSWAYSGGDVTASAGSAVLTIAANAVTYAKMQTQAQATFLMRAAGAGTGVPIAGTAAQAKAALAITTSDVAGLGTIATQNAANLAVGTLAAANAANAIFGEGSGGSFNGDIYAAYSTNTTGANFYAYRVYDSGASPIAGWRGDGAVIAAVMVQAPNFTMPAQSKGTVTSTVSFDFRQSGYQSATLTNATACTASVSNAPQGPTLIALKIFAPASGTSPAVTWPATFKGGWPTVVTLVNRYNLLIGWYDGTNYNYIGGSLNVA